MAKCYGARLQLFGKELVVAQSLSKLAEIEGRMGMVSQGGLRMVLF